MGGGIKRKGVGSSVDFIPRLHRVIPACRRGVHKTKRAGKGGMRAGEEGGVECALTTAFQALSTEQHLRRLQLVWMPGVVGVPLIVRETTRQGVARGNAWRETKHQTRLPWRSPTGVCNRMATPPSSTVYLQRAPVHALASGLAVDGKSRTLRHTQAKMPLDKKGNRKAQGTYPVFHILHVCQVWCDRHNRPLDSWQLIFVCNRYAILEKGGKKEEKG